MGWHCLPFIQGPQVANWKVRSLVHSVKLGMHDFQTIKNTISITTKGGNFLGKILSARHIKCDSGYQAPSPFAKRTKLQSASKQQLVVVDNRWQFCDGTFNIVPRRSPILWNRDSRFFRNISDFWSSTGTVRAPPARGRLGRSGRSGCASAAVNGWQRWIAAGWRCRAGTTPVSLKPQFCWLKAHSD